MKLQEAEMKGWTERAEALQLLICRDKVTMAPVRQCLLATDDAYLLHQDNRATNSTPWGGKIPNLKDKLSAGKAIKAADVVGENRLGLIWMRVRDELTSAGPAMT